MPKIGNLKTWSGNTVLPERSILREQKLVKNREIAKLLGLNGTPAFIIGNIIYPGALNLNNLKEIIKKFREN